MASHCDYYNWTPPYCVGFPSCLQTPQNNTELAIQQLHILTQPATIWWKGYYKAAFNEHIRGGPVLIKIILLLMHHLLVTEDQIQGSYPSLHMRSIFKAYTRHTIFHIKKYAMLYSCNKAISQNLITDTNRIMSTHINVASISNHRRSFSWSQIPQLTLHKIFVMFMILMINNGMGKEACVAH